MQKMFTTQLAGLFKRIFEKEEYNIEDGARVLAQALAGEGAIFIKGFKEMEGVLSEAIEGVEPLKGATRLESTDSLTHADRVLLITRFANDEDAISLGEKLVEKNISFVAIAGENKSEGKSLADLADVFIQTSLVKPLLPTEDGNRVGFPSLMAALYIYFSLKFSIEDILEEYE
ncbi:DUF2529 domain-containing protein [Lederbergia wuyishanensis]|uniref:DUF2529 domain-containing protein n=1 Tax=Lederbergia wuyishanensis TaxID=1347903 RepID=A0ABU0D3E6_9BACI|nr:DUF2529 domain-containing protein [Lederbergia wuyishanensis]MCJ8007901.1 DUF2529 domain-containing protein [Lederbergia wuyishanensis]MDQ0342932.1 hypothetical protein [Lederbergia wuyishanensis]